MTSLLRSGWVRGALIAGTVIAVGVGIFRAHPIRRVMVTVISNQLVRVGTPTYANLLRQSGVIDVARRHRIVADSSVSAVEAGLALQRLAAPPPDARVVAVPPVAGVWSREELDRNPFRADRGDGLPADRWRRRLFEAAERGFSPEERRYLRSLVDREAYPVFVQFSAAPAADLATTRYTFRHVAGEKHPALDMPDVAPRVVIGGVTALTARAALSLEAGDARTAETTLRESLNAAVILHEGATSILDVMIATVAAFASLQSLEEFYAATGREALASRLRDESAPFAHDSTRARRPPMELDARELFVEIDRVAKDGSSPPALVYERLFLAQNVTYVEFCFGLSSWYDTPEWRAGLKRSMARTPHSAEMIDWLLWVPDDRTNCPTTRAYDS